MKYHEVINISNMSFRHSINLLQCINVKSIILLNYHKYQNYNIDFKFTTIFLKIYRLICKVIEFDKPIALFKENE